MRRTIFPLTISSLFDMLFHQTPYEHRRMASNDNLYNNPYLWSRLIRPDSPWLGLNPTIHSNSLYQPAESTWRIIGGSQVGNLAETRGEITGAETIVVSVDRFGQPDTATSLCSIADGIHLCAAKAFKLCVMIICFDARANHFCPASVRRPFQIPTNFPIQATA
ncbi:hypothetical protein C8J56DRAFT_273671 [Mycena floridula]|nr:hypothetical protein C8J56DRAFT_273671 [Mycena floridula]